MNKTNLSLAVLFLVLMFLPATLYSQQKKESLAIFSFTGGSAEDGDAIAGSLVRQAVLRNAFNRTTLITRNTIATMNFEQRFQRNSGLTDADTIFELGKQLNASHVIAGYITKLGNQNLVIVSIMDIESLQQIAGDYRTYRAGAIEEIDALIPEIARKLAVAVPRDTSRLPGLSVPPFNISRDVNQNDAQVLAQILSCDLANANKYAVLPRTDSIEKVREEHQRQRDGTTDQERIKRLGVGRNAKYVLSGSVERLGTVNKFTADILDILDGSFIDGHEERYTSFSQGFELMPKLAAQLAGGTISPPSVPIATQTPQIRQIPVTPQSVRRPAPPNSAIQAAVNRGSAEIKQRIQRNSKIAIISIASQDRNQSQYVIEELVYQLASSNFTVIDESYINPIRREKIFQLNGDVDDNSSVTLGRFCGADIVINGSVSGSGLTRRLRIRVLDVRTGQIIAMSNEAF